MAVRSILKNAAQTAGGHIEKAVIEIIDMRGRDVSIDPPVSVGGSSVPGLSAASTFGGGRRSCLGAAVRGQGGHLALPERSHEKVLPRTVQPQRAVPLRIRRRAGGKDGFQRERRRDQL